MNVHFFQIKIILYKKVILNVSPIIEFLLWGVKLS